MKRLNNICIFAMRLSAFDGTNQNLITQVLLIELTKDSRYAVKLSRVSFFNLIILSPYRWLVKRLAQLQFTRLLEQIIAPIGARESFLSGAFSFSFLFWAFFFSLSFKYVPMRSYDQLNTNI